MKINSDWLRLAGTAALLIWLIGYLDWEKMLAQLTSVSLPLFLLALLINALATIVTRAMLVWSLLEKSSRPTLLQVVEVFFSLRFFSTVLPKAIVVGLRINRLNKLFGRNLTYAAGLMSYEALTAALVMSAGAIVFYLALADEISRTPAGTFVFVAAALLITVYLLLFTRRLDWLVQAVLRLPLLATGFRIRVNDRLLSWRSWVGENIITDRPALFATVGFAVVFYLGFIVSGYILFAAMGENLGFAEIAWARSAVWLLAALPLSIGGLGVREAGLAYVLADFGVDFELAVAYGFLSFILQTTLGLLGASVELKNAVQRR